MPAFDATATFRPPSGLRVSIRAFADEAIQLLLGLAVPGGIIGQVERSQALRHEAHRIADRNPLRAAALRRQASHLGFR